MDILPFKIFFFKKQKYDMSIYLNKKDERRIKVQQ